MIAEGHHIASDMPSKLLDVEYYIAAAKRHGDNSEGDHEVGDLQEYLREMWELLSPAQRAAYATIEAVQMLFRYEAEDFDEELAKLHSMVEGRRPDPPLIRGRARSMNSDHC